MLQSQINYWNLVETQRHNLATEEAGIVQAMAAKSQAETAEKGLTYTAKQAEASMMNAETNRLNLDILNRNADIAQMNAETNRYNAEINEFNALVGKENAETNARNAAVNETNAATNRINAITNQWNAATNEWQAAIAEENVEVRKGELKNSERQTDLNVAKFGLDVVNSIFENTLTAQKTETEKQNTEAGVIENKYRAERAEATIANINADTWERKTKATGNIVHSGAEFIGSIKTLADVGKSITNITQLFN